jgi:hypothetical protein
MSARELLQAVGEASREALQPRVYTSTGTFRLSLMQMRARIVARPPREAFFVRLEEIDP